MKKFTLTAPTALLLGLGTCGFLFVLAGSPAPYSSDSRAPAKTSPSRPSLPRHSPTAHKMGLIKNYGRLPLSFEANQGQTDPRVKFLSRGRGYALFLTSDAVVLSLQKPSAAGDWHPAKVQKSKFGIEHSPAFPGLLPRFANAPPGLPANNSQPSAGNVLSPHPQPPALAVIRMKLAGANPTVKVSGTDELAGRSNYFIGDDPKKWRANVPNYAKIEYQDVYPGIDLVYYGNQQQLEYDFIVAPGADPHAIRFEVVGEGSALPLAAGGNHYHIDANGDLVIAAGSSDVRLRKPVAYQPVAPSLKTARAGLKPGATIGANQNRQSVEGRYVLLADNRIGFDIGLYDPSKPLVIDPVLSYSTYLGGSDNDQGRSIAVDVSGNAYVTGYAGSIDFPTTAGTLRTSHSDGDAFVAKLNTDGSALVYSTYLGGSSDDIGYGMAVDAAGNAYVAGSTDSLDFPTTSGAFQPGTGGGGDAFVAKLNAAGSALLYATCLGGNSGAEYLSSIAVDAAGSAYVTGYTDSSDFPTTAEAFQTSFGGGLFDGFVTKVNAAGSALVYSSYLGGSSEDFSNGIAVDAAGNLYAAGYTYSSDFPTTSGAFQTSIYSFGIPGAFVTKLNAAGSALVYSTYLCGSGSGDMAYGVAVDTSGNAYVTGAAGADFPTTAGAFQATYGGGTVDAFVTKLNATGSALVYSTYLGGQDNDEGWGIAVDGAGNAYVTGYTSYSVDFPTTSEAFQAGTGGDSYDGFVTKLNATGSDLVYSTYLAGSADDWDWSVAVDGAGNAYVTGVTASSDFPTTAGAFQASMGGGGTEYDAFIAKVSPAEVPGVSLTPASATFASQTAGTTSSPQSVMLRNVGSAPLSIGGIAASGGFAQTNTCGDEIPEGSSCTIDVTFSPTTTGTATGSITITDNAAGSPHIVALTGNGAQSGVSLSPTSLDFDEQQVGATSPAQLVTLTNTGDGTLTISSVATSTDFVEINSCGSSVAAGAECIINVTFAPAASGTRQGTLTVTDAASGSSATVTLSGSGVNPPPTISSLSPNRIPAGGATFTLTVNGSNFVPTSVVRWNGAERPTTRLSSTQLTTSIPASDIATKGTVAVTVFNSVPAGGISRVANVFVDNPVPTVSSLSPSSVTAGGEAFTLTVTGTGFVHEAVVRWNGADRPTTYLNHSQVTAAIPATDIATAGTAAVTVFNPEPAGGTSNSATFQILDFSLSMDPPSATVTAGQTAKYTATVSRVGAGSQSISLSCRSAPTAATCTVTPSSVTPDGTNSATATVTVTTTARSAAPGLIPPTPPGMRLRLPTLLLLFLVSLALSAITGRYQRTRFRLVIILAALVFVLSLVACGGGGGGGGSSSVSGTPAGTYTLTIRATSGSLTQDTTVRLTVN